MFKGIVPIAIDFVKHNSTLILGVAGCVGTVASMALAVDGTLKAEEMLKKEEINTSELSKTEFVKKSWKCYIPAITVGALTIACTAGTSVIGRRAQASLALVAASYEAYSNKVKKIYGESVHKRIMKSIETSECNPPRIHSNDFMSDSSLDISGKTSEPEIKRTFYDTYSKRYFESTLNQVIQAFYHFNRNYVMFGTSSVNDLYEFLGLEQIPTGDDFGWEIDDEIVWVDFDLPVEILDDGMEVIRIDYVFEPMPFQGNTYTYL